MSASVTIALGSFVVTAAPMVPVVAVSRVGTAYDGASRSAGDLAAVASFVMEPGRLCESETRMCLCVRAEALFQEGVKKL